MIRRDPLSTRWLALLLAGVASLASPPEATASLEIHGTFLPSTPPPNLVGGGGLVELFDAAVASWEKAFQDPDDAWVVDLEYRWGPLNNQNGVFELKSQQTAAPYRILSGLITFDNSGSSRFFADPTPGDHSEYEDYRTSELPVLGGDLNIGRVYFGASGDAADRVDLLSIASHEIGHALGLSEFNAHVPSPLEITAPLPFAGYTVQTQGNDHLLYLDALMNPIHSGGLRYLISAVDVLAEAEISRFRRPNLDPYPGVPEPGAMALVSSGLVLVLARFAARRTAERTPA